MKATLVALFGLGLLVAADPSMGKICGIDAKPAATLLLPYFEVDLTSQNGVTTVFELNNAISESILVHVVIWSNLAIPVFEFKVYLTGYDVQPINMRDILEGRLPRTGLNASNHGEWSVKPPPSKEECFDVFFRATVSESVARDLQDALTGRPVSSREGLCFSVSGEANMEVQSALSWGFHRSIGFATADVEFPSINGDRCPLTSTPGHPTPPEDPQCNKPNQDTPSKKKCEKDAFQRANPVWGSFALVNPALDYVTGGNLVHIEADPLHPDTSIEGQYTFYGRFSDWTATDRREPLATTFAARYLQNSAFSGGTDLIVWRDPKEIIEPFPCDQGPPPPFPLGQEAIVIFDEHENVDIPTPPPISPRPEGTLLNPFPWATQRVTVGSPALPVPFDAGWLYLNLNAGNINGNPPEDPFASQNWVTVLHSAEGRFSVGFDAIQLDSACNANHLDPDELPAAGGGGDDDALPAP